MELLRDIGINIILLFGLFYIVTLPKGKFDYHNHYMNSLIGFLIGTITVFTMMNAFELTEGAIYDVRSAIIGVTTLFFPLITASIATLIALGFRIYIGGVGVYAGSLSIIFVFISALIWKYYINNRLNLNRYIQYYLFGLFIHVFVVLSQLAFPFPQNVQVILNIGPVILLIFPIVTMLLMIAFSSHMKVLENQKLLKLSEKRYKTLINSSKLGIIQYDTHGVIELSNEAFANTLKVNKEDLIGLDMLKLPNKKVVACVEDSINGTKTSYEGNYKSVNSGHEFPSRAQFSPIYEQGEVIGGICILEDLTKDIKQKNAVDRLRKVDQLTKLYNRPLFDEVFSMNPKNINYPLTFIVFDINAFQIFNTTLGYEKGNEALRFIASSIMKMIKPYDTVEAYRTGGDEFSLICYELNEEEINELINAIRNEVDNNQAFSIELKLGFGYSIANDQTKSIQDTFNEANRYLQENKIYEGSNISMKTVDIIMSTLFEKSPREKNHSERVSLLSEKIAEKFSDDQSFIQRVKLAARLHDIGKINISEEILDKPGTLTKEEYETIKKHPTSGFKILSSVPEYLHIANIVYSHHERIDGLGYPRGLKGEKIPLEARIIAVADAFDAMKEQRTYRETFSKNDALKEIQSYARTQFDQEVVNTFLEVVDE